MNKTVTISSAAQQCNVSRATVWRWIKSGKIRASKTAGGHHRIDENEFEEFVVKKEMLPRYRGGGAKKILIVDDDRFIRKSFKRLLNFSEVQLEFAKDGFEAGIKTANFKPDLILLDLVMPQVDGYSVCRQIKENKKTASIKIIAVSGFDAQENIDRIMEAGADLFLAKPVDSKIILEKIDSFLNLNLSQQAQSL